MSTEEQQIDRAVLDLSECMNDKGVHSDIQNIAIAYFDKHIHNDDPFWSELEQHIVEQIRNHEQ